MVAVEPGLWHPVGLGLAIANRTGAATAIHGTPDDIPLSPRRLMAEARAVGLVPELHAVTFSWRRMPPSLQRGLAPTRRARLEAAGGAVRPHADADRPGIQVTERSGCDRGDVVVCMLAQGPPERLAVTLRSVLAHTEPDVATIVYDDSPPPSPTRGLVEALATELGRQIQFVGPGEEGGGDGTLRAVLNAIAPADVALVDSGCTVSSGWLEELRDAAYSDSTVATVSALIPADIRRLGSSPAAGGSVEFNLDQAASTLWSKGVSLRPRLPAARRPCVYVRRSALELNPDRDIEPRPPNAIDAGFSRSCLESGLSHLLSDNVLVDPGEPDRYRSLDMPERGDGPLARAVGGARRAVLGLSALVDARILSGPQTGTHLHVLELLAGLARTEKVHLTAVIPNEPNDYAVAGLNNLGGVTLITYEEASKLPPGQADLVHRPFQLTNAGDLPFLERLGDRLVLTQQDLIAFHNPSYFPSDEAWAAYRHLNRLAMARADQVVFFSNHTCEDAIAEELVEPTRGSVVRLGVDHTLAEGDRALAQPAGASGWPRTAQRSYVSAPTISTRTVCSRCGCSSGCSARTTGTDCWCSPEPRYSTAPRAHASTG